MKKLLRIVLASLALATLAMSCRGISTISIKDPEVTAESKFGAVVLTWDKVDMADVYYIYRADPIATEEAKKAKKDDDATKYSDKKFIGSVYNTSTTEQLTFVDFISIGNILEEGKEYVYTVEAIAGDASDARFANTEYIEKKEFVRGSAEVKVTIAEGNAPAYGTKLPAPEKTTVIDYTGNLELNRLNGGRIQVLPDTIADDKAIGTIAYVEFTATPDTYRTYGSRVVQQWVSINDSNDGIIQLTIPGEYNVATYNNMKGGDYYEASDMTFAEETVKFNLEAKKAWLGSVSSYSVNQLTNCASISWAADKKATDAGVTFKLLKAEFNNGYYNFADGNIDVIGDITEVDISNMKVTYNTNGSSSYSVIDSTIDVTKKYYYFLQVWIGDEIISGEYASFTPSNNEIDITYFAVSDFTQVQDAVVVNVDSTRDYYAYFTANNIVKDVTAKAYVEKFSSEKGYGEAEEVSVTLDETVTGDDTSKYLFNILRKGIAKLEKGESWKYTVVLTAKTGEIYKVVWTESSYIAADPVGVASITIDAMNSATVTTATSTSFPVVLTTMTGTDLTKVTVKLVFKKEVGASYAYTVYTMKDFALDPGVVGIPQFDATKTFSATDLTPDATYQVSATVLVDGVATSTTASRTIYTPEN